MTEEAYEKNKVIHTRTFSCADDHPIVYYTFDENNEAICEYCSAKFIYEPKKRTPLEEMQERLEPIGEAIAWRVENLFRENPKLENVNIQRITFNEITKEAVVETLKEPRKIDEN